MPVWLERCLVLSSWSFQPPPTPIHSMPRQPRLVPLASQVEVGKQEEGLRPKGGEGGVGEMGKGGAKGG